MKRDRKRPAAGLWWDRYKHIPVRSTSAIHGLGRPTTGLRLTFSTNELSA